MTDIPIKIQFVKSLSTAQPSRIVAVKADGDVDFALWVTDKNGLPFPLKDNNSGTITAIQNTDGNLVITGSITKTINVAPALLSLINSALQAGDNISDLTNDTNYITLADIPTFVPSDYDLEDFTNTALDPFAKISDLSSGVTNLAYTPSPTQGIVTSDTGSDATIPLADVTNAGLVSPAEKVKLNNLSNTNSGDQTSIVGITGTKAQFNTAVTDGDILYVGDITQYTDESAQDAVGGMLTDTTTIDFTYDDGLATISADVRVNSIDASHLSNSINVSEFINDADYATEAYVDGLVVGLLDDRGVYDASVNVFPSTGGSGTAGAILKGDIWFVSVAGTLGGQVVNAGDSFRALVDSPAQITTNWSILEANIGYVPENITNKSTSTSLGTSDILYPTQNAVKTYADAKVTQTITNGVTTTAPSEDAVFDALVLKYDASNPNGYETSIQLDTRDTNNRNRANHTGTQLASTILDIQNTITNNTEVLANTAKVTNATHTGDATGATALTLATVNSNVGTFGDASNITQSTVNAKGLTTAISNVPIQIVESQVTDLVSDLNGKENTSNKSDSYTVSSSTTYASTKALVDGLETKESVYNVNEFLQKNTNVVNLVPLGVDSASGLLINTTGGIQSVGGNFKYKSFTNIIEPSTTYTLDGLLITQGVRISYRDVSNNILGYYSTPTEVSAVDGSIFQIHEATPITFTTPANCVTVLVNTIGSDGVDPTSTMTLTKGTYAFDYYKKFSKWVGKRIHWLGDSMTQNNTMQPKVAQDLKTINYLNGIGGSLITPGYELIVGDAVRRPSFVERAKNNTLYPSDMLVIYGGYNDFGYSAPIGMETDMIAPTFDVNGHVEPASIAGATFYSALNYIIQYYSTTFPDKPIRLITATYNDAVSISTYATQEAYANAMVKAGIRNNIPVLDLFHGSGINADNGSTYTLDGVHFNDAGAALVANKVVPFLNTSIGGSSSVYPSIKDNGREVAIGTTPSFLDSSLTLKPAGGQVYNLRLLNGTETVDGKWKLHVDVLSTSDGWFGISGNTGTAKLAINPAGELHINNLSGGGTRQLITDNDGKIAATNTIDSQINIGTPTAPTATPGTNTTQIANMAALQAAVSVAAKWTETSTNIRNSNTGEVEIKPDTKVSILNASNVETARIRQDGNFVTKSSSGGYLFNDDASGMYSSANSDVIFRSFGDNYFRFNPIYLLSTGGTKDVIGFTNQTVNPTSGNCVFNFINSSPIINQTGGANGITRSLYINPTLTSAADFRAIEVTAGKVIIPAGAAANEAVNKGQLDAAVTIAPSTKTGDYTTLVTDETILVDTTSGNVEITLLAASGNSGKKFTVKKIDSSVNTVTVSNAAGIDGTTTKVYSTQYAGGSFQSNGTQYYIIGNF